MATEASMTTLSGYLYPLCSTLTSIPSATRLATSASRPRPLRAAASAATLREVYSSRVPDHVIQRKHTKIPRHNSNGFNFSLGRGCQIRRAHRGAGAVLAGATLRSRRHPPHLDRFRKDAGLPPGVLLGNRRGAVIRAGTVYRTHARARNLVHQSC